MNIYSSPEIEFVSELKEWLQTNHLDLSELPPSSGTYIKELHPMYGEKHTEESKQKMSESHTGEKNSMYGIRGVDNPNYGRKREDLIMINKSRAGRTTTKETKQKQSAVKAGDKNPMYGKIHTEESKKKMARFGKDNPSYGKKYPQEKLTCPHCAATGGKGGMKRYHFSNCKFYNMK
jgi:hypothetical protein